MRHTIRRCTCNGVLILKAGKEAGFITMSNVEITLPDGSVKEAEQNSSLADLARSIGPGLARAALAAKVDGRLVDLAASLNGPARVEFVTFDAPEGHDLFWHSGSHLLAQAVTRLYPDARYTIGPAVDTGFYYDFDCETTFAPDDLERIEAEMARIVKEDLPVTRRELSLDEAVTLFEKKNNPYKVEILKELPPGETVSVYEQGEFVDLCRGPHVPSTGRLKAFKLTALAGAYWRGDEHNKMLQRIYGIAFPQKKMLEEHLARIEEAKKRDHRKLGKELDLFSFHEEGPGFPFWHAKGTELYKRMVDYIRQQNRNRGYAEIMTPIILNDSLWHRSGHWDNFKENMYFTDIDDNSFAVKPMNCPGGLLIYKNNLHSYRELPIKNAELGLVHRHELSGVLHGLFRVRSFTQDDAHIFCSPDQVTQQIKEVIEYTLEVYRDFGFSDFSLYLATRPDKAIGSDEDWEMATTALREALAGVGMEYGVKEGEGAFYGPKIEFNIKDCLGRNWQCGTVQVDFSMPMRFELNYRGSDGKDHVPVMIHRAIFGSLERFIGIVIEHFAGKLPLWLAPVQLTVVTINDKVAGYGRQVAERMSAAGFQVETDFGGDSLGHKIRLARNNRVPYIVIVGEKEQESGTVSLKTYNDENINGIALDALLAKLTTARDTRALETIQKD